MSPPNCFRRSHNPKVAGSNPAPNWPRALMTRALGVSATGARGDEGGHLLRLGSRQQVARHRPRAVLDCRLDGCPIGLEVVQVRSVGSGRSCGGQGAGRLRPMAMPPAGIHSTARPTTGPCSSTPLRTSSSSRNSGGSWRASCSGSSRSRSPVDTSRWPRTPTPLPSSSIGSGRARSAGHSGADGSGRRTSAAPVRGRPASRAAPTSARRRRRRSGAPAPLRRDRARR